MTEKVAISTSEGQKFTFENNINGEIQEADKGELVFISYYENDEEEYDAFSYDDAIKLRDFLDGLIKKADVECEANA